MANSQYVDTLALDKVQTILFLNGDKWLNNLTPFLRKLEVNIFRPQSVQNTDKTLDMISTFSIKE